MLGIQERGLARVDSKLAITGMSHAINTRPAAQSDIDEIESLFHIPPPSLPITDSASAPPPLESFFAGVPDYRSPAPGAPPSSTLTEPVWSTVKRDLLQISINLRHVVFPNPHRHDPGRALRDWDLWGPFFFILLLGVAISYSAASDNSKVFAVVFAILAAGAVVLTLNVLLLGGHMIFFQSLSLLGYCLFPLDIGAVICMFFHHAIIRVIIVLVTLVWSSWAAYPFVSVAVSPNRKALAVYPVFLLYISISLFVLSV